MTSLDRDQIRRLQSAADEPDLTGTRYALVERVGRGGMGTVYRVRDRELDRDVALKVLSDPDPDRDLARRMFREARLLARLEHPNIVPVHDVGVLPDGRVFYVMKLVQGTRLDAWAQAGASQLDVVRLFQTIADAVAFAHARGVIHRDLKPANIMVGEFGEALVMDWGVARLAASGPRRSAADPDSAPPAADGPLEDTGHGTIVGTAGFMAPEQARGDDANLDGRADVYALGATLRVVLRPPVPKRLAAIAARAGATDPGARYATASELAADLRAFADGLPVSAWRDTAIDLVWRWVVRNRILLSLIGAYVLMRLVLLLGWKR